MRNIISTFLFLSLFLFSGCIHFYDYKTYHVRVVDPELGKPVENASISVRYWFPGRFSRKSPKMVREKTNATGSAKVKVATDVAPYSQICNIQANGYLSCQPTIGFLNREFSGWVPINIRTGNNGEIIVPIYRRPSLNIEIIVPDKFKGPVALHFIQIQEWIQGKPGQRQFSYEVGQNGYLPIKASPLLSSFILSLDYENPGINVRHENGKEILYAGREVGLEPDEIAFRWVCKEGPKFLYIVGTAQDRQTLHDKVMSGGTGHIDSNTFNSYFQE